MTARGDRRMLTVRLSEAGVAELDRIAEREGMTRSDAIRVLLAEAIHAREARKGQRPGTVSR